MIAVNPQAGTVDAVALRIAEKRVPKTEESELQEEPVELEEELEVDLEHDEEEAEDTSQDLGEDEILDEPEEELNEEPLYTVKIDGEELEVSLQEALDGYQRQEAFTKKTMELAEERKGVQEAKDALSQERERVQKLLEVEKQSIQELEILKELTSRPLYSEAQLYDILEKEGEKPYLKAKAAEDKRQKNLEQVKARIEQKQGVLSDEQKRAHEELLVKEQNALRTQMPEIMEGEGQKKLVSYLMDLGFDEEQINSTVDHRLFVIAEESRKYREMIAQGKQKAKKKPPKVLRQKARQDKSFLSQKKLQDLKAKAKRTGKPEDMALYLKAKRKS